ncbi:hypothetical protein Tsubulata_020560 [Turnera subulata]|uniref:Uncharacterized protein n=1 Tax=Turnera subulata TaxID=218843 RepID=A0A9Q0FMM0_9ROSI|nr:hypothetical protein Tsubulata_020560 [Turnera subulata]
MFNEVEETDMVDEVEAANNNGIMDLSEEWKAIFPIGSVFDAPLLLSDPSSKSITGPLLFNPKPHSLTLLFHSPSLSPPLLNPPPALSLSRFLSTSTTADHPVFPSTASYIDPSPFKPQDHNFPASLLLPYNRLQFLKCPREGGKSDVVLFFPTGVDLDQVGFLLLSVKGKSLVASGDGKDEVFIASKKLGPQILRILVNPVGNSDSCCSDVIGCLLVYTLYSVHWFCVKVTASKVGERPVLGYLGCKVFKTCPVVGACWSPHLAEECVVLLEDGGLVLFDLEDYRCKVYYRGSRLKVSWDDSGKFRNCKWLGCEFSWHPRILVVARSDAVFLVDWRDEEFKVTCLAKIDMFGLYAPDQKQQFLAFSAVVFDRFYFVLASDTMLVLCDVRKPLHPVLQWAHGLNKPCYADVFRLSQLRSNARDNTHKWANESGYGIILGSFWNCEFGLFCYGPSLPTRKGPIASELLKISKSVYAWELPSDLFLSGHGCQCGNCLLREELLKDSLPEGLDWQQKRDLVLGFGILSNDLSSLPYDHDDEFGGFTLIRLMSSGKVESQGYSASWKMARKLGVAHRDPLLCSEDSLLYISGDGDYKFPKKYRYLELDYLNGYLNGKLYQVLDSNMENSCKDHREDELFSPDIHEILCKKLEACGFTRFRTAPAIRLVFNDINLPTSVHEIALRRIWADLPVNILQLAFSSYSELVDLQLHRKKVPIEFLVVPDLTQLPPFLLRKPPSRSSRMSHVEQFDDNLLGPALPLPVLLTVHELRNGRPNSQEEIGTMSPEAELGSQCREDKRTGSFSPGVELSNQCSEVLEVAREMAICDSKFEHDDDAVSLANNDDKYDVWVDSEKPKPFFLYHPVAFHHSTKGNNKVYSVHKDDQFSNLIAKVHKKSPISSDKVSLDHIDDLCLLDLKYEATELNPTYDESRLYNALIKDMKEWQREFVPHQEFCNRFGFQKQNT